MTDWEQGFRAAMAEHGLVYDGPIIRDGRKHRIQVKGDRKANSEYKLYADEPPAGWFRCYKRLPDAVSWSTKSDSWKGLTAEQREELKRRARERRRAEDAARAKKQAEAAARAKRHEQERRDADPSHPYLVKKGVQPYRGLKQIGPRLFIPLYGPEGKIVGGQFIDREGEKRFIVGMKSSGAYFPIGGKPERTIVVAEGYATGATIHEATGLPVAVALDCGNLMRVGEMLRGKLGPKMEIVFAADDDRKTLKPVRNPGVTYATAAAEAVRGAVALPPWPRGHEEGGDFNDIAQAPGGMTKVRQAILSAAYSVRRGWALEELLSAEFAPRRWIVEKMLPEGLALAVGPPKLGKSRLLTALSAAVGHGGLALGMLQAQRTGVLYIDLEDPPEACKERWMEVLAGDDWPRGVHVYHSWPSIGDGCLREIEEFLRENDDVGLVVIDTLAKVWSLGGAKNVRGNAYHQEYAVLSRIKALAERFHVVIFAVHHESKFESSDALKRASGTMAMTGAPDALWLLTRPRNASGGKLYVTGRGGVREREIDLRFDPFQGTWAAVPDDKQDQREVN